MEALGEAVSRIRRTQKGELLIQLRETGARTAEFKDVLSEALKEQAGVRTLTQRITIELKDMDEVTTKKDICEAIKAQFGVEEISPADCVSLRKGYGSTQTATLLLPAETAKRMLKAGKIKIGWVVCRIRERTHLTKCFRCLEFGHLAKHCITGEDRSKLCMRCGTEGHIAKNCTSEPLCMFCRKEHPDESKHVAGSKNCPAFRRALNNKKP